MITSEQRIQLQADGWIMLSAYQFERNSHILGISADKFKVSYHSFNRLEMYHDFEHLLEWINLSTLYPQFRFYGPRTHEEGSLYYSPEVDNFLPELAHLKKAYLNISAITNGGTHRLVDYSDSSGLSLSFNTTRPFRVSNIHQWIEDIKHIQLWAFQKKCLMQQVKTPDLDLGSHIVFTAGKITVEL